MSNPRSFRTAIWTSTPRTSSASRSWRVRRARCSGRAPQAGVVRYITNKPKLNVTEATVNAGYATTAHGGSKQQCRRYHQHSVDCRHAGHAWRDLQRDARRIHQQYPRDLCTRRHRPRHCTTLRSMATFPPTAWSSTTSTSLANDINPVTYRGLRVEALYRFNEDWNALLRSPIRILRRTAFLPRWRRIRSVSRNPT